jgi:hypothetical protein
MDTEKERLEQNSSGRDERTVKGCTRLDQIRNEDIRNELGISPLSEKLIQYRNKWNIHVQRMEHTRIPLQAYKYQNNEIKSFSVVRHQI